MNIIYEYWVCVCVLKTIAVVEKALCIEKSRTALKYTVIKYWLKTEVKVEPKCDFSHRNKVLEKTGEGGC